MLFATTIEENIKYGKVDATDEEVRRAADIANASAFIESFPNGYKTMVCAAANAVCACGVAALPSCTRWYCCEHVVSVCVVFDVSVCLRVCYRVVCDQFDGECLD